MRKSTLGMLVGAAALFAIPTALLAAEQNLEFKFVVMPTDLKVVQAPNIDGQILSAGKYFGVAFFKDGRVAVKDFISAGDLKNGLGPVRGYTTAPIRSRMGPRSPRATSGSSKPPGLTATIPSCPAPVCMTRRPAPAAGMLSRPSGPTARCC
jgi:hypothetical protein